MKVERSSLDQVKKRFEMNKRKKEEKKKEYDFEERMRELKEEVMWSFMYFWVHSRIITYLLHKKIIKSWIWEIKVKEIELNLYSINEK